MILGLSKQEPREGYHEIVRVSLSSEIQILLNGDIFSAQYKYKHLLQCVSGLKKDIFIYIKTCKISLYAIREQGDLKYFPKPVPCPYHA
jgi:hypothetical protein